MKAVIILTFLATAYAAPKPSFGHSHYSHGSPIYTETYAPAYHEAVYSAPVKSYSLPVEVHAPVSTVISHRTPTYSYALPPPTVVKEWTTHSVGPAEYYYGNTEVHTTSQNRYNVHVPVTYTYTIDQPIKHSTTYYNKAYSAPSIATSGWSSSYIPSYSSSSWGAWKK